MVFLIKTVLAIFLVLWIAFGGWLLLKYGALFGPHPDDPAETAGARSFGVAHVVSIWVGFFGLAVYFLFFR